MVDSIVDYITIVLSFQIYLDLIQTIYGIHKKEVIMSRTMRNNKGLVVAPCWYYKSVRAAPWRTWPLTPGGLHTLLGIQLHEIWSRYCKRRMLVCLPFSIITDNADVTVERSHYPIGEADAGLLAIDKIEKKFANKAIVQ